MGMGSLGRKHKVIITAVSLIVLLGVLAYLFMGPWNAQGLRVGDIAVDFTLKDIHGTEYTLSHLLAEKPVALVVGSFT